MLSFQSTYVKWLDAKGARKTALAKELDRAVPETWRAGDPLEQSVVLVYIALRNAADQLGIVLLGLSSMDSRVAETAAAVFDTFLMRGLRLRNPDQVERRIEEFIERYPQWETIGRSALKRARETRKS